MCDWTFVSNVSFLGKFSFSPHKIVSCFSHPKMLCVIEKMTRNLRLYTALAEDLSSAPSTHIGWLTTIVDPAPWGSRPSVLCVTCTHIHLPPHRYMHAYIHMHVIIKVINHKVHIFNSVLFCPHSSSSTLCFSSFIFTGHPGIPSWFLSLLCSFQLTGSYFYFWNYLMWLR